jgi:hypothetical protein
MWHDLLVALSLVFVIEGILPFVSPASWREAVRAMLQFEDRTLRLVGLISMLLGLALLYLVN